MMELFSEYWWDAYLWNIDGIVVWPVWFTLFCIAVVLVVQLIAVADKRKRNSVLIVACIVGSLLMPFTGEFEGELAFRQACAKDAGLTIYKKVKLQEAAILNIDSRRRASGNEAYLIFEDIGLEIDKKIFDQKYVKKFIKIDSPNGYQMVVIDKKNGEILSSYKGFYGYGGALVDATRLCKDLIPLRRKKLNFEFDNQVALTFGLLD